MAGGGQSFALQDSFGLWEDMLSREWGELGAGHPSSTVPVHCHVPPVSASVLQQDCVGHTRGSWDPQERYHTETTVRQYKYSRSIGYKELISIGLIDPKARCDYFCWQYPFFSTLQYL